MPSGSLRSRAANYLLGEGAVQGLNALIYALLLSRLDGHAFGTWAVAAAIAAWALPAILFGMPLIGAREISRIGAPSLPLILRILSLRLGLALLVWALTLATCPRDEVLLRQVLLAYGPAYLIQALQLEFVWIGLGRARIYAGCKFAAVAVQLIGFACLLHPGAPIWIIPLILAGGWSISLLIQGIALWRLLRTASAPVHGIGMTMLIRLGFPAALALIIQLGQAQIDVLLLGLSQSQDRTEVGSYAALAKLAFLATFPQIAMQMALAPQLSVAAHAGDAPGIRLHTLTYLIFSVAVACVGAVALFFLGPPLIATLTGRPPNQATMPIAGLLGLAYFLMSCHLPFTGPMSGIGGERFALLCSTAGFAMTLLMSVVLIPWWHGIGAALAQILGHGTTFVVGIWAWHRLVARIGSSTPLPAS